MGESSHKAMRAKDLDEVIFAGTTSRPMRNTAEVVLFVDNSDRGAPAAFNNSDVLEVSRRIEREVGSAYRINGREVRARDVQLLFADASSGARSPALVRQGQIGEIVKRQARIPPPYPRGSGRHRRPARSPARGRDAPQSGRHQSHAPAGRDRPDRRPDRRAQAPGSRPGRSLQEGLGRGPPGYQSMLIALRWRDAEAAVAEAERTVAERNASSPSIRACSRRRHASSSLPPRRWARCARPKAVCGAVLQRLNHARTELDREEARAKARTEDLDRRLVQLAQDLEREGALAKDAAEIHRQVRGRGTGARRNAGDQRGRRRHGALSPVGRRITLTASEKSHDDSNHHTRSITSRGTSNSIAPSPNGTRRLGARQRQIAALRARGDCTRCGRVGSARSCYARP